MSISSFFKRSYRNVFYVRNANRTIRKRNGGIIKNPSRIQWHKALRGIKRQ